MERLDAFMARAAAAYYAARDPFADFITAPEITQVFGELLGLWAAVVWEAMGAPDPVLLVEAGPGRGTLMADALRAVGRTVPAFRAALRVHLIETSPRLRAAQAEAVPQAAFHRELADIPPGPMLLLANEFLDALPIRQFVRRGDGWAERFVVGADGGSRAFLEAPASAERLMPPGLDPLDEGDVIEVSEAARAFAAAVADRVMHDGGAALFVDYGPAESGPGDTLQALRDAEAADPLASPGEADVTAHVDFAALAAAARARGAAVWGPVPQGKFLVSLGLYQRTDRLARGVSPARAMAMVDGARRLAEPDRMGRLFKAMAVCRPGLTLPGFAT